VRFVNDKAGYFPLLFYLAWVPYILSLGSVPVEGPFAHGLAGVPEWCRWALSYVVNLWPYFSSFIVTATFWVLVAPVSVVVGALPLRQPSGARGARARRRQARGKGSAASEAGVGEAPGSGRVAAEAAAFPSTLAESLGQALVPAAWIHQAVTVVTEDVVSYPAKSPRRRRRRRSTSRDAWRVGRSRGGARRVLGARGVPRDPRGRHGALRA
jgi:hypothetical protein